MWEGKAGRRRGPCRIASGEGRRGIGVGGRRYGLRRSKSGAGESGRRQYVGNANKGVSSVEAAEWARERQLANAR